MSILNCDCRWIGAYWGKMFEAARCYGIFVTTVLFLFTHKWQSEFQSSHITSLHVTCTCSRPNEKNYYSKYKAYWTLSPDQQQRPKVIIIICRIHYYPPLPQVSKATRGISFECRNNYLLSKNVLSLWAMRAVALLRHLLGQHEIISKGRRLLNWVMRGMFPWQRRN